MSFSSESTIAHLKELEGKITDRISEIDGASVQAKSVDLCESASAYYERGTIRMSLRHYGVDSSNKVVKDLSRCIEIWEQLSGAGKLVDEVNLAKAYYYRHKIRIWGAWGILTGNMFSM